MNLKTIYAVRTTLLFALVFGHNSVGIANDVDNNVITTGQTPSTDKPDVSEFPREFRYGMLQASILDVESSQNRTIVSLQLSAPAKMKMTFSPRIFQLLDDSQKRIKLTHLTGSNTITLESGESKNIELGTKEPINIKTVSLLVSDSKGEPLRVPFFGPLENPVADLSGSTGATTYKYVRCGTIDSKLEYTVGAATVSLDRNSVKSIISRGLGRAPRGERFLNVTLLLGQSDEPCTMKHRLFKHEVTSLENYKVSMQRATFDLGKVVEAELVVRFPVGASQVSLAIDGAFDPIVIDLPVTAGSNLSQ